MIKTHVSRSSGIDPETLRLVFSSADLARFPTPYYPTYQFGALGLCDRRTEFAAVFTVDGSPVSLLTAPETASTVVAQLNQAEPLEVMDMPYPAVVNNQIVLWRQVKRENGQVGWLFGNVLTPIAAKVIPGTQRELNGYYLKTAPDDNAGSKKLSGTLETFVSKASPDDVVGDSYWFVQTDQGDTGYDKCSDISCARPWKPVAVDGLSAPPVFPLAGQAAGGGGGAVAVTCPGFNLPSRLSVGMTAQVIPNSTPNFLNSKASRPSLDKTSVALGNIPPGDTLTVTGGPQCNQNILWWSVNWHGKTGWTGEGTGNTYWVEPAN